MCVGTRKIMNYAFLAVPGIWDRSIIDTSNSPWPHPPDQPRGERARCLEDRPRALGTWACSEPRSEFLTTELPKDSLGHYKAMSNSICIYIYIYLHIHIHIGILFFDHGASCVACKCWIYSCPPACRKTLMRLQLFEVTEKAGDPRRCASRSPKAASGACSADQGARFEQLSGAWDHRLLSSQLPGATSALARRRRIPHRASEGQACCSYSDQA